MPHGPGLLTFEPKTTHGDSTLRVWAHPAYFSQLLAEIQSIGSGYFCTCEVQTRLSRFSLTGSRSMEILQQVVKPPVTNLTERDEFFEKLNNCNLTEKIWPRRYVLNLVTQDVRLLRFHKGGKTTVLQCETLSKDEHGQMKQKRNLRWPAIEVDHDVWSRGFYAAEKEPSSRLNERRKEDRSKQMSFKGPWILFDENVAEHWSLPSASGQFALSTESTNLHTSFSIQLIRKINRNFSLDFVDGNLCFDKQLSGFDIILPAVWSSELWKALVFAGARCIGLEEEQQILLECGRPSFPRDYLDTSAGRTFWADEERDIYTKQRTLSKSKKAEVVRSKASCLDMLFSDTYNRNYNMEPTAVLPQGSSNPQVESPMSVVREEAYLEAFFPPLNSYQMKQLSKHGFKAGRLRMRFGSYKTENVTDGGVKVIFSSENIPALPALAANTMVMIFLQTTARGTPQAGAELYSLSPEDYSMYILYETRKRMDVRLDRKRVGRWNGKSFDTIDASQNNYIGLLTSGGPSHVSGHRIGMGVCAADKLYSALQLAARIAPPILASLNHDNGSRMLGGERKMNTSSVAIQENLLKLVFFRNPRSAHLRVALMTPLTMD